MRGSSEGGTVLSVSLFLISAPTLHILVLFFAFVCCALVFFFVCSFFFMHALSPSLFLSDDLQEQKADIDQFLSSESHPDVTVSSEESVEVPSFEGKPFRPFQVDSLGSKPEPEGKFLSVPGEFFLRTSRHSILHTALLFIIFQEGIINTS